MIKKLLLSFFLFLLALGPWVQIPISATTLPAATGSLLDDLNNNLRKQEELKNNIENAKNQQRSLANQISIMENQIALANLQIDATNTKLATLAQQIQETVQKLAQSTDKYNHMVDVADVRIRKNFKESFASPLDVLLTSDNVNYILIRQKYAEAVHKSDVNLMNQLREIKESIAKDKANLDQQKTQTDALKIDLVKKQNDLTTQTAQKGYLLRVTLNNEQYFQKLLEQAQAEAFALQAALSGSGQRIGPVHRGDVIAFQGYSGCVLPPGPAGSHLHFEQVASNHNPVDPLPYLNSGYFSWPERGATITQYFGENAGQFPYDSRGHLGIDMNAGYGAPIYAARDGSARLGSDPGCGWGPGKGIIVDYPDGSFTMYWHIK